jgi:NADPH:quinone reductase-like Zn-dependent oxidoreductase
MKVLIHGGGGAIGSLSVQIAKHLGAHVAATTRSSNVDYVKGLGADEVIAYDREDFAERLRGYDVVYDLVGGDVHRRSYRVLKKGGALVWLIADPIEDLSGEYSVSLKQAKVHDRIETLEQVMALAGKGALKPQVGKVFPLTAAAEAHRLVESGTHTRGRVVLKVL